MTPHSADRHRLIDWIIMFLAPLFFASNLVYGRGIGASVAPFTLAFVRWFLAALILFPFLWRDRTAALAFARTRLPLLLCLGFLGMVVCGAGVYWSLIFTSASNATLIYTTSPLFILCIEALFNGRKLGFREVLGTLVAFAGVAVIVMKGDVQNLVHFSFNPGDLGVLLAAIAWAFYSVLQRNPAVRAVPALPLFALMAMTGTLLLAPFALFEYLQGAARPDSSSDWLKIAGIVIISSVLAFSCFQHGIRTFGAAVAGVLMYLMPPFSIALAFVFLGETIQSFHVAGIVLVMTGVIAATLPAAFLTGRRG